MDLHDAFRVFGGYCCLIFFPQLGRKWLLPMIFKSKRGGREQCYWAGCTGCNSGVAFLCACWQSCLTLFRWFGTYISSGQHCWCNGTTWFALLRWACSRDFTYWDPPMKFVTTRRVFLFLFRSSSYWPYLLFFSQSSRISALPPGQITRANPRTLSSPPCRGSSPPGWCRWPRGWCVNLVLLYVGGFFKTRK